MDYEAAYDVIIQLRDALIDQLRSPDDYRTIQALAAAYTLQDYTADRIAEQGETPEGADLDADA